MEHHPQLKPAALARLPLPARTSLLRLVLLRRLVKALATRLQLRLVKGLVVQMVPAQQLPLHRAKFPQPAHRSSRSLQSHQLQG